ncbi:MAG TPA: hypothetical protein PKD63_10620 [Solirubrobacteraceae bacterium]|nr:hypothetical protein [Solirubrobacteraceae bacterium]
MGRRSRKRGVLSAPIDAQAPPAREAGDPEPAPRRRPAPDPGRRARLDEAPRPPWHPVPLTELSILVGLIVLAAAFIGGGPTALLVGFGLVLVVLATGELALREHLAGYRSHSALLAGLGAILVAAPLAALARPPKAVVILVAAVVFLVAMQLFRDLFRRRSGGVTWRA